MGLVRHGLLRQLLLRLLYLVLGVAQILLHIGGLRCIHRLELIVLGTLQFEPGQCLTSEHAVYSKVALRA